MSDEEAKGSEPGAEETPAEEQTPAQDRVPIIMGYTPPKIHIGDAEILAESTAREEPADSAGGQDSAAPEASNQQQTHNLTRLNSSKLAAWNAVPIHRSTDQDLLRLNRKDDVRGMPRVRCNSRRKL